MKKNKEKRTYVFIDASNLFYGGVKSLGWKIDYKKLFKYLRDRYGTERVLYFGGVEIYDFSYDYLKNNTVSINKLENYLTTLIKNNSSKMSEEQIAILDRHINKTRFYKKLKKFGYELYLRPVKFYKQNNGDIKRKADCDAEMAFYLMKEKDNFERVIILSGDGDFLPVLKHLKIVGKEVIIFARGKRTAKEIKQLVGGNFRDFVRLRKHIEFYD
jgi:uncharacterized LabA/DUF88 family protein